MFLLSWLVSYILRILKYIICRINFKAITAKVITLQGCFFTKFAPSVLGRFCSFEVYIFSLTTFKGIKGALNPPTHLEAVDTCFPSKKLSSSSDWRAANRLVSATIGIESRQR